MSDENRMVFPDEFEEIKKKASENYAKSKITGTTDTVGASTIQDEESYRVIYPDEGNEVQEKPWEKLPESGGKTGQNDNVKRP